MPQFASAATAASIWAYTSRVLTGHFGGASEALTTLGAASNLDLQPTAGEYWQVGVSADTANDDMSFGYYDGSNPAFDEAMAGGSTTACGYFTISNTTYLRITNGGGAARHYGYVRVKIK